MVDKNKALDAAMSQIERAFGKGSIMRMGAKAGDQQIEVIPSGSLGLDLALGIGGMPRGRVLEIYGPESSGKTTLALHAIAEAQRRGGTCAFIDAEHALDPIYARKLGVDVDNPHRQLRPQMLIAMHIEARRDRRALVPSVAVVREQDADHVFVVNGERATLTPVKLGPEQGGRRALLDGLGAEAQIVLDGAFHLNNERMRRNLEGTATAAAPAGGQ